MTYASQSADDKGVYAKQEDRLPLYFQPTVTYEQSTNLDFANEYCIFWTVFIISRGWETHKIWYMSNESSNPKNIL